MFSLDPTKPDEFSKRHSCRLMQTKTLEMQSSKNIVAGEEKMFACFFLEKAVMKQNLVKGKDDGKV